MVKVDFYNDRELPTHVLLDVRLIADAENLILVRSYLVDLENTIISTLEDVIDFNNRFTTLEGGISVRIFSS